MIKVHFEKMQIHVDTLILTAKNVNGSLMNHLFVVVVRGLEEKLFILTKEKENLEDELNALQQKVEFCQ